ncbi:MAG TPA: cytochrome c [Sphingomicrobium sp.]
MHSKFLVAAIGCLALAACGGSQTSQANNVQANIDNNAAPPQSATASTTTNNGMVMLAAPLSHDRALQLMHERHEGMENIGKANKAIGRELQRGSPDLGVVRTSAATIADLSQKASGWFPAGTGPDVAKTRAKPEIWQNAQDFSTKLHNFQVAAKAFNDAAAAGDVSAIKARFADLGGTCKACHEKYRAEEKH